MNTACAVTLSQVINRSPPPLHTSMGSFTQCDVVLQQNNEEAFNSFLGEDEERRAGVFASTIAQLTTCKVWRGLWSKPKPVTRTLIPISTTTY